MKERAGRTILPMIATVLATLGVAAPAPGAEATVRAWMVEKQIPAACVAVLRKGRVAERHALGWSNLELKIRTTPTTVFQLASASKTFTGVAVMALVEKGKLELDATIGTWLPDLPQSWKAITLRQLMNHTSGLPDVFRDESKTDLYADDPKELLAKLTSLPVLNPPGVKWEYDQTGYFLAGLIIEKVTGLPFETFMKRRYFEPLGMRSTRYGDYYAVVPGRATYYTLEDGKLRHFLYPFARVMWTGAGLNTSLDDLVKWNLALDSGKLLKPASVAEMWTSTKLPDGSDAGYGMGWAVRNLPRHRSVGHSGGNSSGYTKFIDDGVTVIVLTNLARAAFPDPLIDRIAQGVIPGFKP